VSSCPKIELQGRGENPLLKCKIEASLHVELRGKACNGNANPDCLGGQQAVRKILPAQNALCDDARWISAPIDVK
jgi:hypothetical protein